MNFETQNTQNFQKINKSIDLLIENIKNQSQKISNENIDFFNVFLKSLFRKDVYRIESFIQSLN